MRASAAKRKLANAPASAVESTKPAFRPWDERTLAINALIRRYFHTQEVLAEWTAKLATNLTGFNFAHELEWSSGLFDYAAEAKVLQRAIMTVWGGEERGEPVSLETLLRIANQEALRGARYPKHSTSAPSNLMHQAETAAWANLSERIGQ